MLDNATQKRFANEMDFAFWGNKIEFSLLNTFIIV